MAEITKISIPELESFDYNMEEQGPDLTKYDNNIIAFSGDLTASSIGDYTITASLVDSENYAWEDGTIGLNGQLNVSLVMLILMQILQ